MPAALRAPLMAIGEDGDALLLRTWRASHDWKERPPLDAQGREPTWWQPGTAALHEAARQHEPPRFRQPRQVSTNRLAR